MRNEEKELESGEIEIKTADFYLTCYLLYSGFKLIRLEGRDARRYNFIVRGRNSDDNSFTRQYYSGNALVDPLKFKHSIQDLKGVMYDGSAALTQERIQKKG